MKIHQLMPGQTVYDCHSYRMGNTTIQSLGVWRVSIVSVDVEKGIVEASWNNNPPRRFGLRNVAKWTAKKPELVKSGFGYRRKTREEKKAEKANSVPDGNAVLPPLITPKD